MYVLLNSRGLQSVSLSASTGRTNTGQFGITWPQALPLSWKAGLLRVNLNVTVTGFNAN